MEKIYTVSQLNTYVHNLLEEDMFLRNISVEGELSNVNYNQRGHIYFTLKDEQASIPCVMWASSAKSLSFRLCEGDKVKVKGRITTYERAGSIQLNIRAIEKAGLGDLFLKFEKIKTELGEMGMFSDEYKKPIPKYVTKVGIITSPTGSAVQDICKISRQRYPGIRLVVYPAIVQGEGAKDSIAKGIKILDGMNLDVLIVGRGGGSIEDLWCFNEETVAKAIFNANTPVISAVGHQDDYTIADFVADQRASTPSNAAEIAVFDYRGLMQELLSKKKHMDNAVERGLTLSKSRINSLGLKLRLYSPKERLNQQLLRIDELSMRLSYNHPMELLKKRRESLMQSASKLEYLSPIKKLASGYSYITNKDGANIKSYTMVASGDSVDVLLGEGSFKAKVTEVSSQ